MVNSFHFCQCRQYNFFGDHVTSRRLYEQVWSSEYPKDDDKIGIKKNAVAKRRNDKNERNGKLRKTRLTVTSMHTLVRTHHYLHVKNDLS